MQHGESTVDPRETDRFSKQASDWWDPEGSFAPLHRMAPVRLDAVLNHAAAHFGLDRDAPRPLEGLRVLDAGCGGGLMTEPLARLGAQATGVDPAEGAIQTAVAHADAAGLDIEYRIGSVSALRAEARRFDLVLALEVVEHVADLPAFLKSCRDLLASDGLMVVTTLNRTARSFLFGILGAEWILRWLPRGTHSWRKFLRPEELAGQLRQAGLQPVLREGVTWRPLSGEWRIDERNLGVNYLMLAVPAGGAGPETPDPATSAASAPEPAGSPATTEPTQRDSSFAPPRQTESAAPPEWSTPNPPSQRTAPSTSAA